MYVIEGNSVNEVYLNAFDDVNNVGKLCQPRGMLTKELQPAVSNFKNPRNNVCTVPGRKPNPFANMAEAFWILGGRGDVDFITYYNSQLRSWLDDGLTEFHGSYGHRIRRWGYHEKFRLYKEEEVGVGVGQYSITPFEIDQLKECYDELKRDGDSRRPVVSLWNPAFEWNSSYRSKDFPCNDMIMFKVREDKLNMTVTNRSNDIHLGLYNVNIAQFSFIQTFMAAWLEVEVGRYLHWSDSLHLYLTTRPSSDITNRISDARGFSFDIYEELMVTHKDVDSTFDTFDGDTKKLLLVCEDFQKGKYDTKVNFNSQYIRWCCDYLKVYTHIKNKDYDNALDGLHHSPLIDWIVAGMEFLYRKTKQIQDEEQKKKIQYKMKKTIIGSANLFKYGGQDRVWKYISGDYEQR